MIAGGVEGGVCALPGRSPSRVGTLLRRLIGKSEAKSKSCDDICAEQRECEKKHPILNNLTNQQLCDKATGCRC